jgi:hypothetical protein
MKKVILASAFAAAIAMGLPLAAEADTKVKVYLGMPHYGYPVGPDYRFREGCGWYRPIGIQPWPSVLRRSPGACAPKRFQECRHH